jgi:hypothetical protein
VAVLDTAAQPFTSLTSDTNGHGRLMGRIVEDLTCPDAGPCAAEVRNYLAMPHLNAAAIDTVHGGHFGTRTELALAAFRAVQDWASDYAQDGAPQNLVLSMSLGWDPDWLGGLGFAPQQMPLDAKLVYAVLARARCLGVATVAAAGNVSSTTSDGPTVPGAWESLPAPSDCKRYLGMPEDLEVLRGRALVSPHDSYIPLLYAAEAVDHQDLPLSNARAGATPRLVAYGQSAVTRDTRTPHTETLAGSSVSAAIVAATAAYVWAVAPDLTVQDVFDLVHDTGVALKDGSALRAAEVCLKSAGPCERQVVTRVSVCSAVTRAVCKGFGCGAAPACTTVGAGAGASLVELDEDDFAQAGVGASVLAEECTAGGCDADLDQAASSYTPWVVPQPGSEGCAGVCAYATLARTAFVWLDGSLASQPQYITLSDGTSYRMPSGLSRYVVGLPGKGLSTSATLSVAQGSGSAGYTSHEPLWTF